MIKPEWWPQCPWPESVWPMTDKEYVKAIPDPKLRTAISGFLMRKGWEVFEHQLIKIIKEGLEDIVFELEGK
jgi:hypothetical protein